MEKGIQALEHVKIDFFRNHKNKKIFLFLFMCRAFYDIKKLSSLKFHRFFETQTTQQITRIHV